MIEIWCGYFNRKSVLENQLKSDYSLTGIVYSHSPFFKTISGFKQMRTTWNQETHLAMKKIAISQC